MQSSPLKRFLTWVIALACIVAPTLAKAQQMTGVVRDAKSGKGVAGAIVLLLEPEGSPVQQAISDRSGAFRFDVDSFSVRAQVRHIGYPTAEQALPDSAHRRNSTLTITVQQISGNLTPLTSTAAKCPANKGQGEALALFAQAKLGLEASLVARRALPASVTLARFQRIGISDKTMTQTLKMSTGLSTNPLYTTLKPADLIKSGFVSRTATGRTFHGLDPELVVSDAFLTTHCFDVAKGSGDHHGQVGIAFTPAEGRTALVEVSGTLWLDQSPLALRSLEFRYENVPDADRKANAGGVFNFQTADNGVVVVNDWQLRTLSGGTAAVTTAGAMPDLFSDTLPGSAAEETPMGTAQAPLIEVDGGIIVAARWADSAAIDRPLAVVQGKIVERLTGRPLAGIDVRLPKTPYYAVTGDDGSFRIADVLPGLYALAAVDSDWAPFDLAGPIASQVRAQEDRVTPVQLEMDSRAKRTQDRCNLAGSSIGSPLVAARVVYADGLPAKASVVWVPDGMDPKVVVRDLQGNVIPPDGVKQSTTGGGFWSCGVYPAKVTFTATDEAGHKGVASVTLVNTGVNRVIITIRP